MQIIARIITVDLQRFKSKSVITTLVLTIQDNANGNDAILAVVLRKYHVQTVSGRIAYRSSSNSSSSSSNNN